MFTVSIIYSQNITGGLPLFHLNRCSVGNGINIVNLGAGAPLNLNFCLNISNTKKYWGILVLPTSLAVTNTFALTCKITFNAIFF